MLHKRHIQRLPNYGVMTFEEIGQRLGISSSTARTFYCNAMRKLRRQPELFVQMLRMADELDRNRCGSLDVLSTPNHPPQ